MLRYLFVCSLAFVILSCGVDQPSSVHPASVYKIIPKPVETLPGSGFFKVIKETGIYADADLKEEAEFLNALLTRASGIQLKTRSFDNRMSKNTIVLELDPSITESEAYRLKVSSGIVHIVAPTSTGIFYGIQSLRQLLPEEGELRKVDHLKIPAVTIQDHPRFEYRGMHLDVSRHFFPPAFIKKYIDLLALHKMNTFHWHLTDDQGWRIAIDQYPKLTEIGAYRYGTVLGNRPFQGNDNKTYGGFYTKQEVRNIIAYASKRHIQVIPEIEMPGHASAAIAAYPFLSCFPEENTAITDRLISKGARQLQEAGIPKVVQETWGIFDDVFCAGKDSTFEFMEGVLDEVIELFPSQYIHIGGDECPKNNWKRCSDCQARMERLGMTTEEELQSYFINRIEKYLNRKGRKIIGWDEILEGGLAPNATVMSWRGEEGGIEAAGQGHEVFMTPTTYCYLDYYQFKADESKSSAVGNYLPVQKVYSYNPIPSELSAQEAKLIKGAQANVWTEYMHTQEYVEYKILPRMTALAEVVWTPEALKDWVSFEQRLNYLSLRYRMLGYNFAKVDPNGMSFEDDEE